MIYTAIVSKLGYLVPWMVASGAVMTIGDGLYTLLGPTTPTANWIGYQVVSGIGNGLGTTIVRIPSFHTKAVI